MNATLTLEPISEGRAERTPRPRRMLPVRLLGETGRRLSVCAVLVAAGFALAWTLIPEASQPAGRFPMIDAATAGAIVAALTAAYGARRWQKSPELLLEIAVGFELLVALAIALCEHWLPWPEGHLVRGISWVSLLVLAFPLVVPMTPLRAAVAALAAASMGPLALLISITLGNRPPAASQAAQLFLPTYLAAAMAYALSASLVRLREDASRAKKLGPYTMEVMLGRGGMGEVWRARHSLLARPAAIKLVRPGATALYGPYAVLQRFEREARATAQLSSPHTISVFDFGITEDDSFYYVMELLDGLDLETLVRRFGPLPAERVVHLLAQACDSLAEAHGRGLIHRDIKPANLYVCRIGAECDFVKVLDFGLVVDPRDPSRITREGLSSGTPAYMAPEMADPAEPVDGRADLYALGCVGYWLLTGQLVFDSTSAVRLLVQHLEKAPVPPSARTEQEVPRDLEEVILSCLAKRPGERPASAAELRRRLERCECAQAWTRGRREGWWSAYVRSAP